MEEFFKSKKINNKEYNENNKINDSLKIYGMINK